MRHQPRIRAHVHRRPFPGLQTRVPWVARIVTDGGETSGSRFATHAEALAWAIREVGA